MQTIAKTHSRTRCGAMMGKIEEQRGYADDYQALEHMARHSAAGKELLRSFAAHHLAARASVK